MATTVTAADLTVSIKETYTLNGVTYGNSNNKTYTSNGQVLQRVMNVSTSDPAILNFGAADAAGQVAVADYKYFRVAPTRIQDIDMIANKYYFRPLNVNQILAYSTTSGAASPVGAQTYAVMLNASTDCYVNFGGSSSTASATAGVFLKADESYIFDCHPSQVISAIRKSADGNLEISELTQ